MTIKHIAFIRVKNIQGDNVDRRLPEMFPYISQEVAEADIKKLEEQGYEVLESMAYAQMILEMSPEMAAYQKMIEDEQAKTEIEEAFKSKSSQSDAIVVEILTYLKSSLTESEYTAMAAHNYTFAMLGQITFLQFERAIVHIQGHPLLIQEQKDAILAILNKQGNFK